MLIDRSVLNMKKGNQISYEELLSSFRKVTPNEFVSSLPTDVKCWFIDFIFDFITGKVYRFDSEGHRKFVGLFRSREVGDDLFKEIVFICSCDSSSSSCFDPFFRGFVTQLELFDGLP